MDYETLLTQIDGAVGTVTLHRPKVLHALNHQVFDELEHVFQELAGNPAVRVILLTGSGEKAFAAGADITELAATDAVSGERLALRGHAVFRSIERCGKPVIALVNGFALGGGCELAMACTLRVASESARFGQPEVKLGLTPGYGGTQRLPRLVGPGAALRMLLTGTMLSASEALRIGLVDEVVPAAELATRGQALANEIAAMAPQALAGCIRTVQDGAAMELEDALRMEARIFGMLSGTRDKQEGVAAFLEKRPALFSGT